MSESIDYTPPVEQAPSQGYPYPFPSTTARLLGRQAAYHEAFSERALLLPLDALQPDEFRYRAPGFDLQTEIDELARAENGIFQTVEVAGPTKDGYTFLDGILFPAPPVITNKYPPEQLLARSDPYYYRHHEKEVILQDRVVDIHEFPYSDASLGVMLAAYIAGSGRTVRRTLQRFQDRPQQQAMLQEMLAQFAPDAAESPRRAHVDIRMSLFIAASRTLCENGLLILRGVWGDDYRKAKIAGLVPKMHSMVEMIWGTPDQPEEYYLHRARASRHLWVNEVVFQKDSDTAGAAKNQ
jgi:hypothetical protein